MSGRPTASFLGAGIDAALTGWLESLDNRPRSHLAIELEAADFGQNVDHEDEFPLRKSGSTPRLIALAALQHIGVQLGDEQRLLTGYGYAFRA
ncbi:hypothetical protein [Microvirga zambiensis]|uniref:hypothetical protein n=1 Tax=Microvirga zambiensis TaxID=1402137 RepID=UPI00191D799F|nr:hypothetical protein [Microvirga zambiensis]